MVTRGRFPAGDWWTCHNCSSRARAICFVGALCCWLGGQRMTIAEPRAGNASQTGAGGCREAETTKIGPDSVRNSTSFRLRAEELEELAQRVHELNGRIKVNEGRGHPMVIVDFSGSGIGDEHARLVADFSRFQQLTIDLILGETHYPEKSHLHLIRPATRFTIVGLRELKRMPNLRGLNLRNAPIDDAALHEIAALATLESLNLVKTQISDRGLRTLHTLRSLRTVILAEQVAVREFLPAADSDPLLATANVSVEAVRALQMALPDCDVVYFCDPILSRIRREPDDTPPDVLLTLLGAAKLPENGEAVDVRFRNRRVTDLGLWQLRGMRSIKGIDLGGTFVTDNAMSSLSTFPRLQWIFLNNTSVCGASLAKLSKCSELQALSLRDCQLCMEGVHQVSQIKQLKFLDVTGCLLDHDARAILKEALPECRITFGKLK